MATLNPFPSWLSSRSFGILQSSNQLRSDGAAVPILFSCFGAEKPGSPFFYDKGTDALGPFALVCHSHDDVDVRDAAPGDEDLGTVKHPLVSVQYRFSLGACRVGARVRLRQTKGSQVFAGKQFGQIFVLLLLRTICIDRPAAQRVVGLNDDAVGRVHL